MFTEKITFASALFYAHFAVFRRSQSFDILIPLHLKKCLKTLKNAFFDVF